jgi:hypothetical protein
MLKPSRSWIRIANYDEELYAHPGWQWCTFEGAELQTLLLGLQTSFREKLEWLEQVETLTLRLREQREQRAAERPETVRGTAEAGQ